MVKIEWLEVKDELLDKQVIQDVENDEVVEKTADTVAPSA
ncbi:hypothetical protein THERMOS_723 [Bathymodiolus thermophilus thioautotrophic gill symbiont]|uniref:Uncharacterized protein n=1 Tax=Bathymodiolus thermophilus thioautotrophic gill symbiont TaxID=2360 RepID=A0A8H8XD85_9GAMM|nr:hypothetical protein THERMOS_723 [Bathymodiolus thermophilus thioautotrophic gill symbiont]